MILKLFYIVISATFHTVMKVFYLHKYSYTCKEKVKADFSKVNPSEMYEKAASLN